MDVLHKDTVTVFCQYEKSRLNPVWYPTVIHCVKLQIDKVAIMEKIGAETQDVATLNIPFVVKDLEDGEPQCNIPWLKGKKIVIADKIWLPDNEWDDQVKDMLPLTITFEAGTNFDFFWCGEWEDNTPISEENYEASGGFYNYMNSKYSYVFAISSVTSPYQLIKHFEIMGR